MRLATFNIWNNEDTWNSRKKVIIDEIIRIDADIIALQEVPNLQELELIVKDVGMKHYSFMSYLDDEEGLAILSKHPLETINKTNDILNQCAQRVTVAIKGFTLGLTNVHLDWKSVANREKEIVEVIKWNSESNHTDYELLCGDFNSAPNRSSIYNFLVGELSINAIDTSWVDLGQSLNSPTLDFVNNSWLHNRDRLNDIRVPIRYDWLLVKACYPKQEPKLTKIELFANNPTTIHQILPSDHYGVYVDLSFEKKL
ncbi:endonuclease/exonuclease/phosphatase family protein [Sporosarcina limicola]|uniref:Endonuclease/exonuclease/phosphatase family metal-dependent hydrolase n=1 Tax=Sporosarcina limicola TaxID=34101 RepID=A0A927R4X5_9BACL|nr:endonuclease/exonuclease/phosphatase family protein [Sporosarcina limicola]MBE1556696.1 endonuclease/exonuclease/phosphatase family metal-dependent hydrolase [Sporosarcina limicola]